MRMILSGKFTRLQKIVIYKSAKKTCSLAAKIADYKNYPHIGDSPIRKDHSSAPNQDMSQEMCASLCDTNPDCSYYFYNYDGYCVFYDSCNSADRRVPNVDGITFRKLRYGNIYVFA